eukprot:5385632-Pyramimonas_sp.AAC.1
MNASIRCKKFLGFCKRHKIACVQGTHWTIADANCMRQEFRHANVDCSLFQDSTRAGGLVSFIAADLAQQFHTIQRHVIQEGRMLMSVMLGDKGNLAIASAHVPNARESLAVCASSLDELLEVLPPAEQ